MKTAADHEQAVKARGDEPKVTAEGTHIMKKHGLIQLHSLICYAAQGEKQDADTKWPCGI